MDEKEILAIPATITLTAGQWNTVLACLQQGPFNQVAPIIQDIKAQADPQIDAKLKDEPASDVGSPIEAQRESLPWKRKAGRPKKA